MQNLPNKKRGGISIPEFVKLQTTSIDLVVGQRYDTKEDLETRLKFLSVSHKVDFDVGYTTPKLLTVGVGSKDVNGGGFVLRLLEIVSNYISRLTLESTHVLLPSVQLVPLKKRMRYYGVYTKIS